MLKRSKKGQSVIEYTVLMTVIIAALMTMGSYMKRGFQGRWKDVVDDMGDQYDPRATNTDIQHYIDSTVVTQITAEDLADGSGFWTSRVDETNSLETKEGAMRVGNY